MRNGSPGHGGEPQEGKESRSGMGGTRWSLLKILHWVLDAFSWQIFLLCLTVWLVTAWLATGF